MPDTIAIKGDILTPHRLMPGGVVVVEGSKIREVSPEDVGNGEVIDMTGCIVAPGFVDIHVHGGGGYDVMDPSPGALDGLSMFLAQGGVTSFLPTTYTAPRNAILEAARGVKEAMEKGTKGARVLGLHMEGPYISPERCGAQNRDHVRRPEIGELGEVDGESGGNLRVVTMAPEVEGALGAITWLDSRGKTAAAGHTDATYEEAVAAFDAGIRHVSHLFNGMRPFHHREPGVVGAALGDGRVTVELIADGFHVHPTALKMAVRLKGTESTALVSDSIAPAGMSDGEYDFGGLKVSVKKGRSLLESGRLAGSTIRLCDAVRNIVEFTDSSIAEAVEMATSTPARIVGVDDRKGSLVPGMDADITVLDRDLSVMLTMVEGRIVHRR
ncbi:N-acetylglucosamine-6-phosphate deacetylase [Candidatus Bathyarchaeota archaeon]|nr:MAG: N-acetylglucosamine-6-phosphate deacetylase [Candidatus Bathyarchaeota archaeon]